MILTKEQLTKSALKRETVKTNLGDILIQEISAQDMVDYIENYEGENSSNLDKQAKMCQLSIINKNGSKMFKSDEVETLKGWSFGVLTSLQNNILVLNGMIEDDQPRPVSKKRKN